MLVGTGAVVVLGAGAWQLLERLPEPEPDPAAELAPPPAPPEPPRSPGKVAEEPREPPPPPADEPTASPRGAARRAQPPLDVLLTEKDHGFTPALSYALSHPLDAERAYDLHVTGSWRTGAGVRWTDSANEWLPVALAPSDPDRGLTVLRVGTEPVRVEGMTSLHAFSLSERIGSQLSGDLTLHLRDWTSGRTYRVKLDARKHPLVIERSLAFEVEGLDPERVWRVTVDGPPGVQLLSLWGESEDLNKAAVVPRMDGPGSFTVLGEAWGRLGLVRGSGVEEVRVRVEEDTDADATALRRKRLGTLTQDRLYGEATRRMEQDQAEPAREAVTLCLRRNAEDRMCILAMAQLMELEERRSAAVSWYRRYLELGRSTSQEVPMVRQRISRLQDSERARQLGAVLTAGRAALAAGDSKATLQASASCQRLDPEHAGCRMLEHQAGTLR